MDNRSSQSSAETSDGGIDLATYLPYLIHRLGAWTSPRRALRQADGRVVRLREWRMLLVIAAHGRLTSADVGYLTGMDSGSTTRALQVLIDDGLVASELCVHDRRRSWLTLTERGTVVYGELATSRAAYNDLLLAVLSPDEREVLLDGLKRLQYRAEELDHTPVTPGK